MTSVLPIVDAGDWPKYAAVEVEPSQWTVVIAAAGKGSRLGYDRPKILFPVAGRTVLEWLLDVFLPFCESIVVVLSPEGSRTVEPELERFTGGRIRIAIQEKPTGMADAVAAGLAEVATLHTAVVWGDQAGILPRSAEVVLRLHQGLLAPDLTVPTVLRPHPYIHFERDADGRILELRQAREGDSLPAYGESDAGFFCFRTDALRSLMAQLRAGSAGLGARTSETNFLPVIPLAVRASCRVLTPRVMSVEETIGINTAADAAQLAAFLAAQRSATALAGPRPPRERKE